jgi:hypothetical protein
MESTEVELMPEEERFHKGTTKAAGNVTSEGFHRKHYLTGLSTGESQQTAVLAACNMTGGEIWEVAHEDMDVEDWHHHELM